MHSSQLQKYMTSISCKLEVAIRLYDTCQWITCFDKCQLTITWMSKIKEVRCKPELHVSINLLQGEYGRQSNFFSIRVRVSAWSRSSAMSSLSDMYTHYLIIIIIIILHSCNRWFFFLVRGKASRNGSTLAFVELYLAWRVENFLLSSVFFYCLALLWRYNTTDVLAWLPSSRCLS